MKKVVSLLALSFILSACSSPAQRMAECQAQGISKDTCYMAEQNRQTQMNAVYTKQALENAADAVKKD